MGTQNNSDLHDDNSQQRWEGPLLTVLVAIDRRFDARFYVTFLDEARSAGFSSGDKQERLPTPDGGQEVIEARFVHPAKALEEFHAQRISLYPPQFYLLKTLADILQGEQNTAEQRDRVRTLSQGAFGRMVINPRPVRDPEAQAEGFSVLTYEGDEARGGSPGRRHRSRLKFSQGGVCLFRLSSPPITETDCVYSRLRTRSCWSGTSTFSPKSRNTLSPSLPSSDQHYLTRNTYIQHILPPAVHDSPSYIVDFTLYLEQHTIDACRRERNVVEQQSAV